MQQSFATLAVVVLVNGVPRAYGYYKEMLRRCHRYDKCFSTKATTHNANAAVSLLSVTLC